MNEQLKTLICRSFIVSIVFLLVYLLPFVNPLISNSFNNSLTSENLTFTGDENITRYLEISKNANVTSAMMNLSGYINGEFFFGDDKNITLYDGPCVNSDNDLPNATAFVDKDLDTYSSHRANNQYGESYPGCGISINETRHGVKIRYLINYTDFIGIPINYTLKWYSGTNHADTEGYTNITLFCEDNSNNLINFGSVQSNCVSNCNAQTTNFEIPQSCRIENKLNLTMDVLAYNPSQDGARVARVYEGKIFTFPTSPYIDLNNTQIWNHTGEFNSTFSPNQTDDFSTTLNDAINGSGDASCPGGTLDGNNCIIPFLFHSDTAGILEYDDINIVYDDLCEYDGSGNWEIELFRQCTLSTDTDIYPNNIIVSGDNGSVTINATITMNDFHFTPDDFDGDSTIKIIPGGQLIRKP